MSARSRARGVDAVRDAHASSSGERPQSGREGTPTRSGEGVFQNFGLPKQTDSPAYLRRMATQIPRDREFEDKACTLRDENSFARIQ